MTNASATNDLSSRTSTTTNTTVSTISRQPSLVSVGAGSLLAWRTGLVTAAAGPGMPSLPTSESDARSEATSWEGILAFCSAISFTSVHGLCLLFVREERSLHFQTKAPTAKGGFADPCSELLVCFQHCQERLLRDLDLAYLFHPFFAGCLLGPKLAFARDVAAITLGGHILLDRLDCLPGDDPAADGCLNRDFEQVAVDFTAQLLHELASAPLGQDTVYNRGQ